MKTGDKVIVRGFSKIGTVINDDSLDNILIVEFEKVRITVDKKSMNIVLPKNCVQIIE